VEAARQQVNDLRPQRSVARFNRREAPMSQAVAAVSEPAEPARPTAPVRPARQRPSVLPATQPAKPRWVLGPTGGRAPGGGGQGRRDSHAPKCRSTTVDCSVTLDRSTALDIQLHSIASQQQAAQRSQKYPPWGRCRQRGGGGGGAATGGAAQPTPAP
jgi:hypothetical protein